MKLYARGENPGLISDASLEEPVAPDEDGGYDLPDELAERLHNFHNADGPLFEFAGERSQRLVDEELERRRDPGNLYDLLLAKLGNDAPPADTAPPKVTAAQLRELLAQAEQDEAAETAEKVQAAKDAAQAAKTAKPEPKK